MAHVSVLLQPVLEHLTAHPQHRLIDATYGRGGHTQALLQCLEPDGRFLALDQDPQAIEHAQKHLGHDPRCLVRHTSFVNLRQELEALGWWGQITGLLLDLGVSSPQLDDPERGFSFRHDGPLDMRMDPTTAPSAATWLNHAEEQQIAQVLKRYGEEPRAKAIARMIVRERAITPWTRTTALAEAIAQIKRGHHKRHPATQSFQAIRIHVNQELAALETLLPQVLPALALGGRAAIISFHSLEDRCVKRFFQERMVCPYPKDWPEPIHFEPDVRWVAKKIIPTEEECAQNPRARSAVLRVIERCR